jgi:hypothetical protein
MLGAEAGGMCACSAAAAKGTDQMLMGQQCLATVT